jgi:hypothetical protein
MNLATLRVEGEDEAVAHLCNALRRSPDTTWKKGDAKRRGGAYALSGFAATIADSPTPAEMVRLIRQFLAECKAQGVAFAGANLFSELALGVTVGNSVQFVAFVSLAAEDLSSLGALGINLCVAAYPTSDEANAADEAAA